MKKKLKKFTKKNTKNIVIIGVIFLLCVVGIKVSSTFISQSKVLKLGLNNTGKLVTQTACITLLKDNKEDRDFFNLFKFPFTESRQIFSYDFEVDAYVDFTKIELDVKHDAQKIIVKLPHAVAEQAKLIEDSQKIYLDEESIFSNISLEKHADALNEMIKEAKEKSIKIGLLEAADRNAQKLIEGFIKSAKEYKEYNVEFKY